MAEDPEEGDEEQTDEEAYNEWAFGEMTEILGILHEALKEKLDGISSMTSIQSESDSPDDGMNFEVTKGSDKYLISITQAD
jgi:hypothetical protein